ncbi:CaiB/BaiF CoA transferase family protein [Thalassotalea mangrovi]|uniref:CoA transferase n=1 Tax=Thalassotalea mangrovi TaxID=2572245 RepID=A0A4U1B2T6_9GAMM|nr:CaiB/BaiF CoA-transferase family protein [Thalassotalea mangrovi]TKB43275.1 CoA transferase [Thalassotalea mangrovi]
MAGPLTGVKVLDLSRILAGPWATQVLADYGADVWKIERPGAGDDTRHWGPPYLNGDSGKEAGMSAYYLSANRGKKSICVDITSDEGQSMLREMAKEADIVVENYKVGGLEKYGLDYASLQTVNPRLIYCSITGFGQSGPYANRAGYDAMIQGMGGLMSLTGERDDLPGGGPQKVGVAVADLMTGMYAVSGILAALHHRDKTGEGQHIDLALLDTQVSWLANQASNYLVSGEVPSRLGTAHPNIVPYQAMKVQNGHMLLAVGNDKQFRACCDILGCPELPSDPRFMTNADRVEHRDILINFLENRLLNQPLEFWLEHLSAAHVPCGPINTLDKVFDNPQLKHRHIQFELEHPIYGTIPQVGNPVKFSKSKIEYNLAPPGVGEHSDEFNARYKDKSMK